MGSPYWVKTLLNKTFSQRFFYSKLTNYPIIGRFAERALFEGDDILYLPKDTAVPVNAALAQGNDLFANALSVEKEN